MRRREFLSYGASLTVLPKVLARSKEYGCDIAVIGGGTGGFAAALAALRNGMRVVLTEETDWIGGQLTAQAVPPDEHRWIEQFGSTGSYRQYREGVRSYYRQHFPLTEEARRRINLNPGNGSVSRLTHEPRVSVAVLEGMLMPYLSTGQLQLLLRHQPVSATVNGDRVTSVTVKDLESDGTRVITAHYFLDATELGDLLPMTKTEFVTGAESQTQTGEPHASSTPEPANSQSFTQCFAMDYLEGEDHTIEKPTDYAFWRDYVPDMKPAWAGKLLSWVATHPITLKQREAYMEPNPETASGRAGMMNYWIYRRIADRHNVTPGSSRSDITLVNWPQNDYWLGDLLTSTPEQAKEHLHRAKQLSFSWLYWMQTEAPREKGGTGWKGLRLRHDIVGTEDGLAKYAYIREARRIHAEFTVLEQHVGTEARMKETGKPREEVTAAAFPDSVGVGSYRIDLHPSAGGTNYIDISSLPFQIPLGSLIPKRMENLLPACKNLGVTHITNGCYRLHPVEWNIGEAAGALATHAIKTKQVPRKIRNDKKLLADFQASLRQQGFELEWPRIQPA